ncbi:arsenic resistance protein [Desulfogranum mediterraneum]|uniref:arsenic resistance protein n=1 Tax=Desulfogranum mediterraneum TaxID=160661 RepID=UPI0003F4F77B|nr:bile acid:sodium symporter [Desulfogranum mediterraneum]
MWRLLKLLHAQLIIAIPLMLAAGFLVGSLAGSARVAPLKALIMPLTFLMVYPMMVTLNVNHLLQGLKNVRLQLISQLINFGLIPFIAYGLGLIFFQDQPYLALGLLLAALLPTSGMTISWTGFAHGNTGAAINMTIIGLTLGSLATPFYVLALLGTEVSVNISMVLQQILLIVFVPMILGILTRQYLLKRFSPATFKQEIAPRFPTLSTVGVLGIVFVAMALKAGTILSDPSLLLRILLPLVLIYLLNFSLSTLVGKLLFNRGDAIALVYGTVMRNLSIALAIAINAFGEAGANAALVIAVSYVIQVQSAAWYVRFTDTLFGPLSDQLQG